MISIIKDGDLALQRMVNYGVDMAIDTVMQETGFSVKLRMSGRHWMHCIRVNVSMHSLMRHPLRECRSISAAKAEVTESFRYLIGNISRIMDYYISRNPGTDF